MHTIVLGMLAAATFGTVSTTLSVPGAIDAERATLSGRVVDAETGEALEDARVRLSSATLESRTDEEGTFSFARHDVLEDTLLVSRDGYHVAQVVIADIRREHLDLRIELRPAPAPVDRPDLDPPALLLRQIMASSGATAWSAHQFQAFLPSASHPLELLLFSGLVESLTVTSGSTACLRIAGAEDCAALWLEGRETNAGDIGMWLPSHIERIWVVPPDMGIADLDLVAGSHPGLVVIFLSRQAR